MGKTIDLDALLTQRLGVAPHPKTSNPSVAASPNRTNLVTNDPNRLGLTIVNLGAFPVYVMIDTQVSASRGILLAATGGTLTLNWEYDMTLVSNEWWALSVGGESSVLVVEVVSQ